jgi:hypothetical protein
MANLSTAFGFTGNQINKLQNDFFKMIDTMQQSD